MISIRSIAMVFFASILASVISTSAIKAAWFNHEVSEKPAESAVNQSLPSTTSSIGASAKITYKALSDALSSAMPTSFHADGHQQVCADLNEVVQQSIQKKIGGDVGKIVVGVAKFVTQVVTVNQVRHVCQDVDYKVEVVRTGPITISSRLNKAHVSITVAITGQAGFSGDVAKALSLSQKNFRGGIEATIDLSADVDDHWCPHLQGTADTRWTDRAELEIIHNVWLGIEGQVGDKIKDQLKNAISKLQSTLKCDVVTSVVRNAWHPYSLPIKLPDLQTPSAYVNFTPTSIGFSGINYGKADISLAMSVDATTEITTDAPPSNNAGGTLPPLKRIPFASNTIILAVPIKISYDDAVKAAKAYVKGRIFEADTPAGNVKIAIKNVEFYPSNDRLALRLQFSVSTKHRIFDTHGTVYLLAEPTLDVRQQTVKLQNVSFTAILDNKLWSTLAAVFDGPIKEFIESRALYDLSPKISVLQSKLQSQLATVAARQNIGIELKPDFIGLRSIHLERKTLDVVVGFNGSADFAVDAIKLPPLNL